MTRGAFEQIVIDPPWPKKKGGRRAVRPHQGLALGYSTLSIEDIDRLLKQEILPLAADIHNVWLWCVDEFLAVGEGLLLDLGYRRHARLIWNKLNGVAPAFTLRFAHEYLVWFYKPSLLTVDRAARGKLTTVFEEAARQHSRKPDRAYRIIDRLYPMGARIDVFSREKRDGWEQWGDQIHYYRMSVQ